MKKIVALFIVVLVFPVLAQDSPSFKLNEHVFNAGGHPANGTGMGTSVS